MSHQYSVVKLHGGGVFKEVLEGGREGQQIVRNPFVCHLGEGVIHQPSVQPSNKCTCEETSRGSAVWMRSLPVNFRKCHVGSLTISHSTLSIYINN